MPTNLENTEIWAEYFRVKNELMDLWDSYVEAVSNMRILDRLGKPTKRVQTHKIIAERALNLLYHKGVPAGAIQERESIQKAIDEPENTSIDEYRDIAKHIMQDFKTVGLYNISREKNDPARSISNDRSY